MNNQFKALSISYKSAPVEVREKVSLNENGCKNLLQSLKNILGIHEALILSTCNRTEIYYSHEEDCSDGLLKLLFLEKGLTTFSAPSFPFENILDPEKASNHLFRVAMGLESHVVGDIQISNQVKKAYQWCVDMDMAAPFLHRLMHTIFFTNKRVSQETTFRSGAASVSYAVAELVHELTNTHHNTPNIVVLGTGEIGTDTIRNLQSMGFTNVFITNRTSQKADLVAKECEYKTFQFESIPHYIEQADVIISTVPVPDFITKEQINDVDILSFKCFIDLCVPRSIQAEICDVAGVLLYNIDQINERTSKTIAKRKQAIPEIENIIKQELSSFKTWLQETAFSPTIHKLKTALEKIRQDEMARHLKQLDSEAFQQVDKITKGMVQKILKLPVLQLKAACKRGEAEMLADVLHDLFNLEQVASVKK